MDPYTKACADWLDKRFTYTDKQNVYYPHAPIYGYAPSDPRFEKFYYDWMRCYSVLSLLGEFNFVSAIDVGSAEGYLAAAISSLFHVPMHCAEISCEAIRRVQQLYGLSGTTCDAHQFPFADGAFDLVVCTEVLEHVTDPGQVLHELVRITRQVLVVTTPARWERALGSEHLSPDFHQLHEHIHLFTDEDFLAQFEGLEAQVTLYGIRPLLRGINRLHLAAIRNRPPLWLTRFLLQLNHALARPFRGRTAEFLAVVVKDQAIHHPLGFRQRARWHNEVLDYLLRQSARPPLYLP